MQPTLQQPANTNSMATLMINPLINKLNKINERSEDCATYGGIATKCFGFMAANFIGVALAMLFQALDPLVMDANSDITYISPIAVIFFFASLVFFILTPFLAFIIKKTIPVTGTLFCASTGYLFSLLAILIQEYRGAILLAVLLTVVIVSAMALVYAKGWIKVDQKFRSVIRVLFWSTIVSSLLVGGCYFIPVLRCVPEMIGENPLINIGASLVYVVIAAMFLLVDFDTIQKAVERKLPRKYEWYAAFGLAFSVIWLFLKVFNLIVKMKNSSK